MLRPRLAAVLSIGLALSACAGKNNRRDEFAGLGTSNASSEPPAGIRSALSPGDLGAIQERGKLLFDMERALRIAYEDGLSTVGEPKDDVIMPIVDVDPGGKSAQVVFLRWSRDVVGGDGRMSADDAERWLLVSLLLGPDRVLDVELLHGEVVPRSHEHLRAQAIIEAAKQIEDLAPGERFHMLAVPEESSESSRGVVTRVYAFSAEGSGPDVELVVEPPKRKRKPPRLLSSRTTHPAGAVEREPVVLEGLSEPAAMTVTRVMLRGAQAEPVAVKTGGGAWRVMPADGRILPVEG